MKVKHVLTIVFFVLIGYAQKQGNLKGKVIDKITKQPVPYANVYLQGTPYGTTTDTDGIFMMTKIPEDLYNLIIEHIQYNSYLESEVRVIRNKTAFVKEIELVEAIILSDEIKIAAGAFKDDKQNPISNFSYSQEEIRRAPGAGGDIFRAIETLPGVNTSGGEFSSFSVRGGAPGDNIILIDNIPFISVTHFTNSGGNEDEQIQGGRFSIFTSGLFEEADFHAGGFSVKYGGKNASILNLKLKEGNRDNLTINGTYDLLGWEANYDGPVFINNNTGLIFSARHQDFEKVLEMIDEVSDGTHSFSDYIIKLASELNPQHKLSYLGLYSIENSNRRIDHIYKGDDLTDNMLYTFNETKTLSGLNWRFLTGQNSFLQTSVYYQHIDRNGQEGKAITYINNRFVLNKDNAQIIYPLSSLENKNRLLGVRSDFTIVMDKNINMNTGFEISSMENDFKTEISNLDTVYIFDGSDYRPNQDQKYLIIDPRNMNQSFSDSREDYSLYSECSWDIYKNLTLNPGLRYELNGYSSTGYFSPRLSMRYQLSEKTSLNFATGIYYQTPDMEVIIADLQNRKLKSEKAIHYILGMNRFFQDDMKLCIESYYKDYRDLIVIANRTSNTATNKGTGYSYGIDFSLIKRFVDKLYWQINYSYSHSKLNDHDGLGTYYSDFSQPHVFNILVSYQLNKCWSFSSKWRYASGRPTDSYIIHSDVLNNHDYLRYSQEITGKNDVRFNDFHSLNIRFDYRRQFSSYFALIAYLDIINVYDHLNENYAEFNEYTGELKYLGLKMIPTFGFRLEF